ncbi:MAG: YciI family protein [Chloroflexota bacterium]
MKYLLLIYTSEAEDAKRTPEQQQANMGEYFAYTEELGKTGSMVGGEALQPIATATSVRVRDGQTMTSDGPFAETKEQLGGYYLIDVENLDDAIHWAAKIPGARDGTIEVRPLWEFDGA